MPSLEVCSSKVFYTKKGDGPGLVLLHGTNSDGSSFNHILDHFITQRTVITPDYAGCGQSTIPEGDLKLELLVEQIAAVIRDVNLGPVDLVGTSLGAVVAASVAATYPDLVRRLILVAGFARSNDPRHHMMMEAFVQMEELDPKLSMKVGAALAFSPEFLQKLGQEGLNQLLSRPPQPHLKERFDIDARVDIRDQLPKIKAPTLVVGLTKDYMVPLYHAHELNQGIKGSEYTEIESGHVGFAEKPMVLANLIREFVLRR